MAVVAMSQVADLHRNAHRAVELACALEEGVNEGRLLVCDLLAALLRLSADPRGLDRELIARARQWIREDAG